MDDFDLPGWNPPVPVRRNGAIVTQDQLLQFPAFETWQNTLRSELHLQQKPDHEFHNHPYMLRSVTILSVVFFGKNPETNPQPNGFILFKADISNDNGSTLPGVVFLRGGSVAMLMILRPRDDPYERWVIMTTQPRIPASSLSFWEIPAGMLDREKNFTGAAAKEIREETGLEVDPTDLKDMTALALESAATMNEGLKLAMYPSPGGCDEYIPIYLWEKTVDRPEMESLKDKLTGQRGRGELIRLKLVQYEQLWRDGARDAKTLAAWALYEGLNREGKL